MDYLRLRISISEEYQELLIADLFDMDFDGFEETEGELIASIQASKFDDFKREEIERILFRYGNEASIISEELIPEQNWNEQWEQSIRPQSIGKFYVRPSWGAACNDESIEIIIDPKMAFGTGYHATTRLLLRWLPDVIQKGDSVLDAGTGTGILGIGALKLGAGKVFGFDIDEWSKENAEENIERNKVSNFEVRRGSVETIPPGTIYDVVLANINRNALMDILPQLQTHLKPGGKILLSGLLKKDESPMLTFANTLNLKYITTRQEDEWVAILLEK